ncbi:glycosyltransferase family 1 protein [Polychaeton citri CBS 116435]|uniref:sterol 3beta-glucosyltransferase n=1 Tax=Polychaeton citri CBS 116435 TaxID=1314669 RepID=A0A9P4QBK7_9PEZI|nr:glycosyltransferase family 1 protein [Polychaeton citri CBS 116435]
MASRQSKSVVLPPPRSSSPSARHRPGQHSRGSRPKRSPYKMELPARFRDVESDDGGVEDDDNEQPTFVAQSMYGMLAAATTQKAFTGGFAPDTIAESDSDDERPGSSKRSGSEMKVGGKSSDTQRRQEVSEQKPTSLPRRPPRDKGRQQQLQDPMTQSQILPSRKEKQRLPERPLSAGGFRPSATPVLDQKLQAQLKAETESPSLSSSLHSVKDSSMHKAPPTPQTLAQVLAQIFNLTEPEEVIAEFPCWYLQNMLLEGYFYVTERHLCFYALLQRKANKTLKSGHVLKRGQNNPKFRRYWLTLKNDVLSYYMNANEPYFPRGTIDLRHAITAELVQEKGQDPKSLSATFDLKCTDRTHHFRAESAASAKEWVRQLQKVIFRSHNDGHSVKICLPILNVMDVERSYVANMAETMRVRVVDEQNQSDPWASEEYYFSFFEGAERAVQAVHELLKRTGRSETVITDPTEAKASKSRSRSDKVPRSLSSSRRRGVGSDNAGSGRRRSRSLSRSSIDTAERLRLELSQSPDPTLSNSIAQSVESFITSSEQHTDDDFQEDVSASQMLDGDVAFREPTIRSPRPRRTLPEGLIEDIGVDQISPEPARAKPPHPATAAAAEVNDDQNRNADRRNSVQSSGRPSFETTRPARFASPFQYASNLTGYVRKQSKVAASYLSTSPMTYYDKVTGAIAGGQRHYSETDGLPALEDRIDDPEEDLDKTEHERRFREHFALPDEEKLIAVFYTSFYRVLPLYGKIYLGTTCLCFRSLLYGTRTKIIIPIKDVDNVEKEKGLRLRYAGMVLVIRGHEELFFDFRSQALRDDCVVTVLKAMERNRTDMDSSAPSSDDDDEEDVRMAEEELKLLKQLGHNKAQAAEDTVKAGSSAGDAFFDDMSASLIDFKPKESLRITCLTIGSRGDVQPYIALCKGLMADGHRPLIATHAEFEPWIRKHGIEFARVEGNPAELMQLCVEKGMFTPSFLMETNNMRDWLELLLESAWKACQGADLLIESPSAMCGIHIAEALRIPYFRAFTMPWTRTRAYPHAFAVGNKKLGGTWNYHSYNVMESLFWTIIAGQINRWRRRALKLGPTSLEKLQTNKVPFLYNFSPSVVIPPLDFSDWIRITGYWFLDEGTSWTPPDDLRVFIEKARADRVKLVYIGFGSVVVANARQMTQEIVNAVVKADVRCILSKGWSERLDKNVASQPEVPLPDCIFPISSAPHDWLFNQIDAAVHHGGAGTTGASLRAGIPTIAQPFFGDQFFFATRIEDLGVGQRLNGITENKLGRALWIATRDERMRTRARLLGRKIRSEHGVQNAINAIYRDMEYAKSLIKRPVGGAAAGASNASLSTAAINVAAAASQAEGAGEGHGDEEDEENWTFIEPDSGVEELSSERQDAESWTAFRRFGAQAKGVVHSSQSRA